MAVDTKVESAISTKRNTTKLQFTGGQLIARSRITKTPVIIVEGMDDVPIYQKIAAKIGKKVRVAAAETIPGYSEGCYQVIKLIEDMQIKINESPTNGRYIRGIVDRDVRTYRNEDFSHLNGLFELKVYSYESHFITRNHVRHLLERVLVSSIDVNDEIIDFVTSAIQSFYNELYYISLEALRNACESDYSGVVGYGFSAGKITNEQSKKEFISLVMEKKRELDEFAKQKEIDFNDLVLISKGKWLLEGVSQSVFSKVQELSQHCRQNSLHGLEQCQFCRQGLYDKCLWEIKRHMNKNFASDIMLEYLDENELGYVMDEIRLLA